MNETVEGSKTSISFHSLQQDERQWGSEEYFDKLIDCGVIICMVLSTALGKPSVSDEKKWSPQKGATTL